MKNRLILFLNLGLLLTSLVNAQDGILDTDFDADGKVLTAIGNNDDYCYDIALQADAKIVAVGSTFNGTKNLMAVLRYNIDGSLDNTFGTDGVVTLNFGPSNQGASVVIQPDEKILIGGSITNGFQFDFAVVRLHSDGRLDDTFNNTGLSSVDISGNNDFCRQIHLLPDGKIILTGSSSNGADRDFAIARFTSDGILDRSFASFGFGKNFFNLGGEDVCQSSVILDDGSIILVGYTDVEATNDFALVKLESNGTVDLDFGSIGKVITAIGSRDDFARAVAVQPDGKIIASGDASDGLHFNFASIRYNSDGSIDNSYSFDGMVVTSIGSKNDFSKDICLQDDGKIIMAGYSSNNSDQNDISLVRYNKDGTLDPSFGINGKVITDVKGTSDYGQSILLQSDAKILVGGYAGEIGSFNFTVLRYLSGLSTGILSFSSLDAALLVYPNPINESAMLEYSLANDETINIGVYDASGMMIKSILKNELKEEGDHELLLRFDHSFPSGPYQIVISNGKGNTSIRIIKD